MSKIKLISASLPHKSIRRSVAAFLALLLAFGSFGISTVYAGANDTSPVISGVPERWVVGIALNLNSVVRVDNNAPADGQEIIWSIENGDDIDHTLNNGILTVTEAGSLTVRATLGLQDDNEEPDPDDPEEPDQANEGEDNGVYLDFPITFVEDRPTPLFGENDVDFTIVRPVVAYDGGGFIDASSAIVARFTPARGFAYIVIPRVIEPQADDTPVTEGFNFGFDGDAPENAEIRFVLAGDLDLTEPNRGIIVDAETVSGWDSDVNQIQLIIFEINENDGNPEIEHAFEPLNFARDIFIDNQDPELTELIIADQYALDIDENESIIVSADDDYITITGIATDAFMASAIASPEPNVNFSNWFGGTYASRNLLNNADHLGVWGVIGEASEDNPPVRATVSADGSFTLSVPNPLYDGNEGEYEDLTIWVMDNVAPFPAVDRHIGLRADFDWGTSTASNFADEWSALEILDLSSHPLAYALAVAPDPETPIQGELWNVITSHDNVPGPMPTGESALSDDELAAHYFIGANFDYHVVTLEVGEASVVIEPDLDYYLAIIESAVEELLDALEDGGLFEIAHGIDIADAYEEDMSEAIVDVFITLIHEATGNTDLVVDGMFELVNYDDDEDEDGTIAAMNFDPDVDPHWYGFLEIRLNEGDTNYVEIDGIIIPVDSIVNALNPPASFDELKAIFTGATWTEAPEGGHLDNVYLLYDGYMDEDGADDIMAAVYGFNGDWEDFENDPRRREIAIVSLATPANHGYIVRIVDADNGIALESKEAILVQRIHRTWDESNHPLYGLYGFRLLDTVDLLQPQGQIAESRGAITRYFDLWLAPGIDFEGIEVQ